MSTVDRGVEAGSQTGKLAGGMVGEDARLGPPSRDHKLAQSEQVGLVWFGAIIVVIIMTTCVSNVSSFQGCKNGPFCYTPPLLGMQGKYAEAEPLYERSQAIREKMLGPEHPDVAQSLHNRAELLKKQVDTREKSLSVRLSMNRCVYIFAHCSLAIPHGLSMQGATCRGRLSPPHEQQSQTRKAKYDFGPEW